MTKRRDRLASEGPTHRLNKLPSAFDSIARAQHVEGNLIDTSVAILLKTGTDGVEVACEHHLTGTRHAFTIEHRSV